MPRIRRRLTRTNHGLHSYAAKCPPQLVKYGLRYYSKPVEVVLDPMAGSGTTRVKARLRGRHAVGYDIDPLARLMAQVKSRKLKLKSESFDLVFTSPPYATTLEYPRAHFLAVAWMGEG